MFDLRRLQTLHTVWVHGSLGRAAEALHLTPSAVSQQLAVLEREANCELLVRKGRGVELTEAGRRLVAHAETILDQVLAARADLDRLHGDAHGVVRIASFPTAIPTLLVPMLVRARSELAEIDVRITEAEPDVALELMEAGAVDLAVIHSYDLAPRLLPQRAAVRKLFEDPMYLALPPGHSAPDLVSISSLRRERWIAPGALTWCFEYVQRACGAAGFVPDVVANCTEYRTTLALVRAGVGVAFVPGLALADESVDGVHIRPTKPRRNRHVHLIAPPTSTAAAQAIATLLQDVGTVATVAAASAVQGLT